MTGTWWKVIPPVDSPFAGLLAYVAGGRVVSTTAVSLITVGEQWSDARRRLESAKFVCAMENT